MRDCRLSRNSASRNSKETSMDNWRGKWALITGASAGIGVGFAKGLAFGGTNLVFTARRKDRLEDLAPGLAPNYKISTQGIAPDLADSKAPEKLFAFTE